MDWEGKVDLIGDAAIDEGGRSWKEEEAAMCETRCLTGSGCCRLDWSLAPYDTWKYVELRHHGCRHGCFGRGARKGEKIR
jgi:hypothetical protein